MTDEQLKWTGTAVLIIGTAINGLNIYPAGVLTLFAGGFFWIEAARRAHDVPLIVTNAVMMLTGLAGVIYNYLK